MNIQGRGGDRAHEATTVLVRESFRAAGDPSMYPEQIAGRLAAVAAEEAVLLGRAGGAWRRAGGRGGRGRGGAARRGCGEAHAVSTEAYDPLLGRTYAEIANDAHSFHKCQGTAAAGPHLRRTSAADARSNHKCQGAAARLPAAAAASPPDAAAASAADAVTRWSIPPSPARWRSRNRRYSTASTPA